MHQQDTDAASHAEHAASEVQASHWNAKDYGGEEPDGEQYVMRLDDQRTSNGQLYIDLLEADLDDLDEALKMAAIVEVSNLTGSRTHVPCLHVQFGPSGNLAASLFYSESGKILMRLETGVTLRSTALPDGTPGYILEE